MKKLRVCLFAPLLCALQIVLYSCVTPKPPVEVARPQCSRAIRAAGIKSAEQLAAFFASRNPDYPQTHLLALAKLYVEEGAIEGINSDAAFAQMCLETGFQRYGNLVTPDMNNFCGLGAMDAEHPGERFETPQLGVRAHIQHLQAYATTADVSLKQELVDPRYSWVHKAKTANTVQELTGQWATDPDYGEKLDRLLSELEAF